MGTPHTALRWLTDCLSLGHQVFLSSDYKEQLPEAKTPHEQESIQRQIAISDKVIDTLV